MGRRVTSDLYARAPGRVAKNRVLTHLLTDLTDPAGLTDESRLLTTDPPDFRPRSSGHAISRDWATTLLGLPHYCCTVTTVL